MIIYDLGNHQLLTLAKASLHYSNALQPMLVRVVGTMPAAARWTGSVVLNSKTSAEVVLTRTEDANVAVSGNDINLGWKTDTTTWLAACAGKDAGVAAICVIRPLDSAGEELDAIIFPLLALPAYDPIGVIPAPGNVPAQTVITLNGAVGNLTIKDSTGATLSVVDGVITIPAGVSINGLSGVVRLVDADGNPLATDGNDIVIDVGGGDVTAAGNNTFTGANTFEQSLTVDGHTVSGLYPDRNPVAQIPVLDATLGVCHYLDATFTEIALAYPAWKLVEIRALVRSVNAAITGTVIITPYVDGVAQTPVTLNVGATWAAVTIPLAVETGSIRLVRTGGTLADGGGWITAAFRGITAMVTI